MNRDKNRRPFHGRWDGFESRMHQGLAMFAGGAALAATSGAGVELSLGLGTLTAVGIDRWINHEPSSDK